MVLGIITIGFMFATILVKWLTATAAREKQSRLSGATEKNGQTRHRLKIAVGAVSITEREIEKHQRKIKSAEHRIAQLGKEVASLSQVAAEQDELTREKMRLSEELKKRKGPV